MRSYLVFLNVYSSKMHKINYLLYNSLIFVYAIWYTRCVQLAFTVNANKLKIKPS